MSEESLPDFPLFEDPLRERVFKRTRLPCGVCGTSRGYLHNTGDRAVCPWCIADGAAGKAGIALHVAPRGLAEVDRVLLEERTPRYQSWQGDEWQVCCGKPCVYLGSAEPVDLRGRWASAVGSIFSRDPRDRVEELISAMDPESSPCTYVFRCQVCGALLGHWDRS